jgi:hypothetical protein
MMLFDTESRILLAKARSLSARGDAQFICIAIEACVVSGSEEDHRIADNLKAAIELAIEGRYTVENYLYWKYGIRSERTQPGEDSWDTMDTSAKKITYFDRAKYDNFTREARLAWIDRILETNEVK